MPNNRIAAMRGRQAAIALDRPRITSCVSLWRDNNIVAVAPVESLEQAIEFEAMWNSEEAVHPSGVVAIAGRAPIVHHLPAY